MKSTDDISRLICYIGFLIVGTVWLWVIEDKLDKIIHLLEASR